MIFLMAILASYLASSSSELVSEASKAITVLSIKSSSISITIIKVSSYVSQKRPKRNFTCT
uniref:Secreted protein n=1 Tax=Megaselia scalaris TaxID=36166 RepID=T1GKY6_MEGSC